MDGLGLSMLDLGLGGTAIVGAIWMWRISKLALVVKVLSMVLLLGTTLSILGIVSFNLSRAFELLSALIDLWG